MSVQELEDRVRRLAPDELRRFAEWWESFRENSLVAPPLDSGTALQAESEDVKQELLRRQQEYREHPERFVHVSDPEDLDRFFKEVRHEVAARLSSAGQG